MGGRKSKFVAVTTDLTDVQVAKICQETKLTESEVHRRHVAFLEQYPDGQITREQFYECLDEVWPESQIDKFASHLFAILDQNRSGTIDFTEFTTLMYKLDPSQLPRNGDDARIFLELLFDMFDRNRNGYLEKRELKPLIESIYDLANLPEEKRRGSKSAHAQVKYFLDKLDQNGDKRLSKQEFLNEQHWVNDDRLACFLSTQCDVNN